MADKNGACSLSADGCAKRVGRLRERLKQNGLDAALLTDPAYIFYFTNAWDRVIFPRALLVPRTGPTTLFAMMPLADDVVADRRVMYDGQFVATMVDDTHAALLEAVREHLEGVGTLGCDRLALPWVFEGIDVHDLNPDMFALRRRKDADEVAVLRHAIGGCEAAYAECRKVLRAGLSEVAMHAAMHAAAVNHVGEPIGEFGNDFRAGGGMDGGMPRNRAMEKGEIAILDLGVVVRGYSSDNCRSFMVEGKPTAAQADAHQRVVEALELCESFIRPGASCLELYRKVHAMLDGVNGWTFPHHLGHGIGLRTHEAPRLNPHWDDTFAAGDVITCEPGLYGDDLRAGLRLEQDYLVTEHGVERLTSFPLDL